MPAADPLVGGEPDARGDREQLVHTRGDAAIAIHRQVLARDLDHPRVELKLDPVPAGVCEHVPREPKAIVLGAVLVLADRGADPGGERVARGEVLLRIQLDLSPGLARLDQTLVREGELVTGSERHAQQRLSMASTISQSSRSSYSVL